MSPKIELNVQSESSAELPSVPHLSTAFPDVIQHSESSLHAGSKNFGGPFSCIVDLFEEQVKKEPQALAIVFGDQVLNYETVNERSNQIANFLRRNGVKPETLVPVCLNTGIELVLWLLGIFKAGAAYIPIDPESPIERIKYFLEDSKATIVITDRENSKKFLAKENLLVVDIESEANSITCESSENPEINIKPDNLAYIIYTSGSTGKPKGVMIEHVSLTNYLVNTKANYIKDQKGGAGSFIHLSYTFDASITAMFMPLVAGRPIVIGSKQKLEVFEDPNLFKYAPYDFLKVTPAHLELLATSTIRHATEWLTTKLVIGGEALHMSHLSYFIERGIKVEVVNEYGPTEATVGCSTYSFSLPEDFDNKKNTISIGTPIDNVQLYITDDFGQLVAPGAPGEICIGGVGVARGYLNRPELTREKFIANPFTCKDGDRIYKTGDIGKWLSNGNIEYIGRKDDQVKIRGYRVELGEVESSVNELALVNSSSIVVKKDGYDTKRLVCYYVPNISAIRLKENELSQAHIANWNELYENEYGTSEEEGSVDDEEYNLAGWNDSFTGLAINEEHMREWLDETIKVILEESPGNVLEIGCGMGLIYYRLTDKISKYIGTDFSRSSISQINNTINKALKNYCISEFRVCTAHEVTIATHELIDTIIINSVAQYFPSENYMTTVIGNSISNLNGKGKIIIGDVRDLRLLQLFKARLSLNKYPASTSIREFQWALDELVSKEEELCFSPDYFYHLQSLFPEITHVDIQWKQGSYINELTLYRYTVIIYVGVQAEVIEPEWVSWLQSEGMQNITNQIEQGQNLIAIKDAPNPRLFKERLLQRGLQNQIVDSVGDLNKCLEGEDRDSNEIKNIISLAGEKGYKYKLLVHSDPLRVNIVITKDSDRRLTSNPYELKDCKNFQTTNIPLFSDITVLLKKDIKSSLQKYLPDYMIPADFIAVNELPLTINAKIDRRFLSSIEERNLTVADTYKPAQNQVEKLLVEIWQEALVIKQIGINDNYFDLGGNSITAVRIISKIKKTLGKILPHSILISAPTISELAEFLQKNEESTSLSSLVPIQAGGSATPLFCVHGGLGTVFLFRRLAVELGPDQPIYGLQAKGLDGREPLHQSVREMAASYINEIRTIQKVGPYYLAGYCFGGTVVFEMAQQLIEQGETVALLATLNGISPTYGLSSNINTTSKTPRKEEVAVDYGSFSWHLKQIERLSVQEKILYPFRISLTKLKTKRKTWKFTLERMSYILIAKSTRLIYDFYKKMGLKGPVKVIKLIINENNIKIKQEYTPK
ncbi:MAG: hypothetical protein JWR18_2760, partial [Segetibacter sp.]|nr:hypothetical protein [Segetibacter sp.]